MKALLRHLTPRPVLASYRRVKSFVDQQRASRMTTEEVFTDIYANKRWGAPASDTFCSGSGSTSDAVVGAYVARVGEVLAADGDRPLAFVDLGCGDFRVGQRLLPLCARYVGVDIVRPLVARNRAAYGNATTSFAHLNIVEDALPDGDVCFVRQVLQHLSNDQIAAVLRKLTKYSRVFVTEHYPSDNPGIVPNRDKTHGVDTRVHHNSGVYLPEPPFNVAPQLLTEVLRVPGVGMADGTDQGVIRTYLYRPGAAVSRATG